MPYSRNGLADSPFAGLSLVTRRRVVRQFSTVSRMLDTIGAHDRRFDFTLFVPSPSEDEPSQSTPVQGADLTAR